MKRTFISILCLLSIFGVSGQQVSTEDFTESQSPVNIGLDEINRVFTPPAEIKNRLKSGDTNNCNIKVTYHNFPENAKKAFDYAVTIWANCISSPVQINIHASWEELSPNELGHGKPSLFYRNFKGTPQPNIFYPVALAEKLSEKEYNNSDEADITCSFNQSKPWYFGTDGKTPATQYDFVTAVLHEIGHGLGISGFFTEENGVAQYSNSSNSPSVYDFYVFNTSQQQIADKSLFPCPSAELSKQLTSNSLVFNYTTENNEVDRATVYAPSIWVTGVSLYHLSNSVISDGSPNELMSAHAFKGEAIHNPGVNTLNILSEIGWSINSTWIEEDLRKSAEANSLANENLNVYPNPFTESITFDCGNISYNSTVDVIITDLTGSTVYRETIHDIQYNPKLKVDLSSIKPGIYLANLSDSNYKSITKRIIKN